MKKFPIFLMHTHSAFQRYQIGRFRKIGDFFIVISSLDHSIKQTPDLQEQVLQ